jgi:hypothetical protein
MADSILSSFSGAVSALGRRAFGKRAPAASPRGPWPSRWWAGSARQTSRSCLGEIRLRVRLAERAHLGARERLIKLLVELSEKYGCKGERGLVIELELTERDLAGMLGNTPEWICKQLGVLKQRGLVAYRRGELTILNEVELRRYITPRERRALCRSRKPAMIEVVH